MSRWSTRTSKHPRKGKIDSVSSGIQRCRNNKLLTLRTIKQCKEKLGTIRSKQAFLVCMEIGLTSDSTQTTLRIILYNMTRPWCRQRFREPRGIIKMFAVLNVPLVYGHNFWLECSELGKWSAKLAVTTIWVMGRNLKKHPLVIMIRSWLWCHSKSYSSL